MADETDTTEMDLKTAMEKISQQVTKTKVVTFTFGEGDAEGLMKVAKVPVTATENMDTYEAARRLRTQVKLLATPAKMLEPVDAALLELRDAMAGRSPRKKTQAFDAVVTELETYKANTKILLRDIQVLAQNIQTQPSMPTTEDENIVRALVAILKNYGRVKT